MNYLNLSEDKLKRIVDQLNQFLADLHVHYQNLRQAHWSVEGPMFFSLHEAYEQDYNVTKVQIDDVAERIRALREHPMSAFSQYLEQTQLSEMEYNVNPFVHMRTLLNDKRILIEDLRTLIEKAQDADDEGTIDMAGSMLAGIEKQSWMYQAWINEQESIHKALNMAMQESNS